MDELLPLPPGAHNLTPEQVSDTMSELQDMGMSKDFMALIERGLVSSKLPAALRGAKPAQAFQQAFELIGGVPRLALWADKYPEKFYPLVARMIPQTIAPVLESMPQQTKKVDQWPEWLTARRLAYQESAETAADVKIKHSDEGRVED